MRVLWVSAVPPLPADDGNKKRHWGLLRHIARNAEVSLVCPVMGNSDVEGLRDVCQEVVGVPQPTPLSGLSARASEVMRRRPTCFVPASIVALREATKELVGRWRPDVAFGGLPVAEAVAAARVPVVLDDQNVEAQLYRRLLRNEPPGSRKLARFLDWCHVSAHERRWIARADAVTACSKGDAAALARHLAPGRSAHLVPNGVDLEDVPAIVSKRDPDVIVFVGGMAYAPNVDGAGYLVRQVMPLVWAARPATRLVIVGKDPAPEVSALAGARVEVTGHVPSTVPYFQRASLSVVPLRSGGGTRTKILEAMAHGVPVVSTTVGAEGLDISVHEIVLADKPADIAASILELLGDPDRAMALASAASNRVRTGYTWEQSAASLLAVLQGYVQ